MAVPPATPNMETMANPNEPQLQAPALAPIIEPTNPVPDFLILLPSIRIRYMLRLVTMLDRIDTVMINTKSTIAYSGK